MFRVSSFLFCLRKQSKNKKVSFYLWALRWARMAAWSSSRFFLARWWLPNWKRTKRNQWLSDCAASFDTYTCFDVFECTFITADFHQFHRTSFVRHEADKLADKITNEFDTFAFLLQETKCVDRRNFIEEDVTWTRRVGRTCLVTNFSTLRPLWRPVAISNFGLNGSLAALGASLDMIWSESGATYSIR